MPEIIIVLGIMYLAALIGGRLFEKAERFVQSVDAFMERHGGTKGSDSHEEIMRRAKAAIDARVEARRRTDALVAKPAELAAALPQRERAHGAAEDVA